MGLGPDGKAGVLHTPIDSVRFGGDPPIFKIVITAFPALDSIKKFCVRNHLLFFPVTSKIFSMRNKFGICRVGHDRLKI
jgi:hypothetical protein